MRPFKPRRLRFQALTKRGSMATMDSLQSCATAFSAASKARGTAAAKNGCTASQSAETCHADGGSPYSDWKRSPPPLPVGHAGRAGGGVTRHMRVSSSASTKLTGQPAASSSPSSARRHGDGVEWMLAGWRDRCDASVCGARRCAGSASSRAAR
jgi:hypothetical protein